MSHFEPTKLPALDPADPAGLDALLTEDEKGIRGAVRQTLDTLAEPYIAQWFEKGEIPDIRELMKELGALGILGMHLDGYGCAGMTATQYGVACLEIEATDSGLRSLVSVQGSLAMFAIWRWGSDEQKHEWLPRMAAGEAIGCFGLTEPDVGSDRAGMQTHAGRDGSDWILDGRKTWISNAPYADVAVVWANTDDGVHGFVVPTGAPGFSAPEVIHKLSLRASATGELVLDNVRLPESAMLPEARGLKGPLSCVNEARYGIVWGARGAARSSLEAARLHHPRCQRHLTRIPRHPPYEQPRIRAHLRRHREDAHPRARTGAHRRSGVPLTRGMGGGGDGCCNVFTSKSDRNGRR